MFKSPQVRSVAPLALTFLMALAACSTTQPVGTQMSDAAITTSVKTRFAADPTVAGHNIDVVTQEGTVILSGRVKTEAERAEAARLASKVDGVKDVQNLIKVGDKTPQ